MLLAPLRHHGRKKSIPSFRIFDQQSFSDFDDCPVWRSTGVSPLFRFIRYSKNGSLVPHYDAPFVYETHKRTLMSVVIYLTDSSTDGGETRFLKDHQNLIPLKERSFDDWKRSPTLDEIETTVKPKIGSVLVFDHRLLHDSKMVLGGEKVIIRTDLIFKKCQI